MKTLISGFGSIGRRHYLNLRDLDTGDVRLLRTGPPRPWRLDADDDVVCYSDLSTALEWGPDLVIVANPTALHVEVALSALLSGSHVLIEKPLASSLEQAKPLIEAAKSTDRIVSMAYSFRYHPGYLAVHDAIASGRLGKVFHVQTCQASFLVSWFWYGTITSTKVDLGAADRLFLGRVRPSESEGRRTPPE